MPKKITVNLTDQQVAILEYELLDINEWIQEAVNGRINYARNMLAEEAREVLEADAAVTVIPADRDELIAARMARSDYRNRKKRDEDEESARQARRAAARQAEEDQAKRDEDDRAAMNKALEEAAAAGERKAQEKIDAAVAKAVKEALKAANP